MLKGGIVIREFFGHNYNAYPFTLFSLGHMLMLFVFGLVCYILFRWKKTFKFYENQVRVSFFLGLFLLEALYHYWLLQGEAWELAYSLPFQLCSISLILALALLAGNSNLLFQMVYFIGISGAIQALITPELFLGFPHFRYWQFFITHMLIIWSSLFYISAKGFRPTQRGLWISFGWLNLFAGMAYLVNIWTGGNYMFLAFKPVNPSLLDYLGPYPAYILVLEVMALILFYLLYLPFFLKGKEKQHGL
ncbi:TIGR02206 family membrane protein [Mesobacillus harenae]|uniref:YwaF family protein n=1 Tax=Mesobacillus harenae TaxID=2213203 RepID=UPI0018D7BB16|nr:TIGR02206 family membrane protein [Mesobacillus harenae]